MYFFQLKKWLQNKYKLKIQNTRSYKELVEYLPDSWFETLQFFFSDLILDPKGGLKLFKGHKTRVSLGLFDMFKQMFFLTNICLISSKLAQIFIWTSKYNNNSVIYTLYFSLFGHDFLVFSHTKSRKNCTKAAHYSLIE